MEKSLKTGYRSSIIIFILTSIILGVMWYKNGIIPEMGFWVNNNKDVIWLLNMPKFLNLLVESLLITTYWLIIIIFLQTTFKKPWKDRYSEDSQQKYKKIQRSITSSGLNAIVVLATYTFWFEKRGFIIDGILVCFLYIASCLNFFFVSKANWFRFDNKENKKSTIRERPNDFDDEFIIKYLLYGYTFLSLFFPLNYAILNYDNFFYATFLGFVIITPIMLFWGLIFILFLVSTIEKIIKKHPRKSEEKKIEQVKKIKKILILPVRFSNWLKGE